MSTSTRDHCTLNPGVLSNEFYDIDIMENKIADLCYQIRLCFMKNIWRIIDSFIIQLSFYLEIFIVHLFIGSKLKPFQLFIFEKTFTKKLCLQFFSHLSPP
jgi:hypothetical protein